MCYLTYYFIVLDDIVYETSFSLDYLRIIVTLDKTHQQKSSEYDKRGIREIFYTNPYVPICSTCVAKYDFHNIKRVYTFILLNVFHRCILFILQQIMKR